MRLHRLLPLLALLGVHVSGQCPGQAIVGSGISAPDGGSTTNFSTDTRPRIPSQDEILGQMPPIAPIRTGSPPVDAFYMIFPALSSIFRWSSLFPAQSLLGAFSDNLQPAAAASKVVLVLADDATAKTRVTRQNPPQPNPFGQMMSWPQDFGFRPENFALPNIDMGPQVGSFLAQMPPLPGLLGAAAPVPAAAAADPPAPAAAPAPPAPPAAVAAADPPAADAPQVPFLLGQSLQNAFNSMTPPNFDMSTLLSQAMPQLPNLGQAMPPLPNLGQAMPPLPNLGQAMPPLPNLGQAMPTLPPLGQAAPPTLDFVAQMQRQFFPGMTPVAQAAPAAGTDAQSSDISEVRVRPEVGYSPEAEMAHQKIKSTMEREREREREQEQVPLLWFRMPHSTQKGDATEEKSVDDLRVEAKLRAFERQVIAELKMLQKIELMAKEMRASAGGEATGYRLNYPLSRTPVHKITRADIEQALRDDYVRRLVAKEAQRKTRTLAQPGGRKASGLKRQAKNQDQTMSKEDIVQIMAYAYRMANEQMEGEKGQKDKVYAAYRTTGRQSDPLPPTQEQNPPTHRRWSEDQAKIQQIPQLQNAPMQRQMAEGPQMEQQMEQMQMQQRQWSEEQAKHAMMMQQRQMDPQMMQQRQWSEEQARIQQAQQQQAQPQNPMMMQQRQWSEDPKVMPQMPQMQQMQQERQWADNQARMQQQQQQQQQSPMMRQMAENPQMMSQQQQQQRQWSEEQAKMQQDQQMTQQRMAQQNPMMMQQRQWTEEQAKMMEQQRQMAENPAQMIQQNTMMMQQPHQQTPMMRQWADEDEAAQKWTDEKAQAIQMQQEEHMVGEAGPQMPENEGTARHKVDFMGLGGNKRKKSKSHSSTPAVINYYYAAPHHPAAPSYGSSYGTSYGGGGHGSNAYGPVQANSYHGQGYRTAVGNDEVDEMLRQHQTMARTINPQPSGAVGGADSTPPPTTTGGAPQEQLQPHRVHKRLAIYRRLGRGLGEVEVTSKGCGCGRLECQCGRSCRCGRSRLASTGYCQCKASRRSRRSAEYGTLEAIDEGSLNELRREYKMGLKEITLTPDEDPAEALMRYNAASIREALEQASMEPLEIGGDQYEDGTQQGPTEEQSQPEPITQQQQQQQQQQQYNHQDFVRLTTSTAAPAVTTTTTEATTPAGSESTSEAPPPTEVSTTEVTALPKVEDVDMQQDSMAESSHVTKSISKQEEEIHHLHSIVDQLKGEILKLNDRCNQLMPNVVTNNKSVTESEVAKAVEKVDPEEEQAEDEEETVTSTTTTTATTEIPGTRGESKSIVAHAEARIDGSTNELDHEDDRNWQRILANRGYDTDYLTRSHDPNQNLELPKPCNYEGTGSQEYPAYPEFQADEPTADATEGKTKRALSVKQQALLLNAALNDSGSESSGDPSSTPTPYAMRGKFVRRRRTPSPKTTKDGAVGGWVRSTRQARMPQRPRKVSTVSKKVKGSQVTAQASVSSSKLDSLVDVLKDLLQLQIQKEKRASLGQSQSNTLSKAPKSIKPIKPIKLVKRKRLRGRQHKPMATTTIRSFIQSNA
ncbi:defective chorion protein, FC177 isoform isoform X1 [Drosophila gunungcola]|uniref:defective chorion protein, FC177 isoform isoform X1 n=1 Tax=Drosophila gunungcola TaxID=103775 RepID=UPI0022E308F0|nr:defective chorion protein, FC177 isoform isoform X1 [Drosophila gunungcola]